MYAGARPLGGVPVLNLNRKTDSQFSLHIFYRRAIENTTAKNVSIYGSTNDLVWQDLSNKGCGRKFVSEERAGPGISSEGSVQNFVCLSVGSVLRDHFRTLCACPCMDQF